MRTFAPVRAALASALTALAVVALASNQFVSDFVRDHLGNEFLRGFGGSLLSFEWRFTPRTSRSEFVQLWLAQLLAIAVFVGLVYLLVLLLARGVHSATALFLAAWGSVFIAAVPAGWVRGLLTPSDLSGSGSASGRVTNALFYSGASSFYLAVLGALVGAAAVLVGKASGRVMATPATYTGQPPNWSTQGWSAHPPAQDYPQPQGYPQQQGYPQPQAMPNDAPTIQRPADPTLKKPDRP